MLPAHEHNTSATVHCDFLVFVGVEFNPVHWARLRQGGLDDHAHDGARLIHVSPVPKRNSLEVWLCTNRDDELVVRAQVHTDNSIGMGVIVSPNWNTVLGVPHNEHAVLTSVGSDKPLLII